MHILPLFLALATFCRSSFAAPTKATTEDLSASISLSLFESELRHGQVAFQERQPTIENPLIEWVTIRFTTPFFPKIRAIEAYFVVPGGTPKAVEEFSKDFLVRNPKLDLQS